MKRSLIFGRGPGADITVNDPYVARRHCRIIQEGQRFTVEDLGSTNGTWMYVPALGWWPITSPLPLTQGCRVRIGRTVLPWEAK